MISRRSLILVLVIPALFAGCSVIAGKEDSALSGQERKQLRLTYVETLRNQASLRGEGFRDVAYSTTTPTTLHLPNSVYADAFRVYVTDQAKPARIFIFDRTDRTVRILAVPAAPANGALLDPSSIAVDSGNLIYISDPPQGKVFGYDPTGALLYIFGKVGDLSSPAAVAIDKGSGRIYIADSQARNVKAYTVLGDFQFEISGGMPSDKKFRSPVALAINREGRLFILDGQSKHIFICDRDGKFIKSIPISRGVQGESTKPRGIAVDSAGHIYVSDSVNNNILIFEPDGTYIMTWGRTGIISGDFWTPQGLFIDDRDKVYIADQTNGRIQVYQIHQ